MGTYALLLVAWQLLPTDPAEVPRVRSANPIIAAAIQDATDRSATFHGLLGTI